MNVVILYQSRGGNTERAAELAGHRLAVLGARVAVRPVTAYNIKEMAQADLILLGSWTDGIFIAGQRPGQMGKFRGLPDLSGKTVGAFCTYRLRPGKTVQKLLDWAELRGANPVGGHAIHSKHINDGATELADMMAEKLGLGVKA